MSHWQTWPVRISVGQFAAGTDKSANLAAMAELLDSSADDRPDVVVFPEAAMHDFGSPQLPLGSVAEDVGGPFVAALTHLARRHDAMLVAGMFEPSDDVHRPYNTVVAVDSGGLMTAYRKTYLYDSFGYRESDRLTPGPGDPVTVDVGGFRLGLMTCYDLRFPEFARSLVDGGADVLVTPAAWVRGPAKEDHWSTLLRARAIENTVYVVAAAQCGTRYCGRSMIVDPMGALVASLAEQQAVITGRVDRDRIEQVRSVNPSLTNRRVRSAL